MAAFSLCFLTDGIVYTFGILLVELSDNFDEDRATIVTIVAILTAGQYLTGFITDAFGKRFGYRVMAITGAVVSSVGFISSYFATSIYFLWISYGLIGGIGFGLMYSAAIVCVLQHFKHHRSLASGITASGTGVGTFVLNYSCRLLIDHYGWRGTVLLQAGIAIQGVIFGLLLADPIKKETKEISTIESTGERHSFLSSLKDFISSCFRKDVLTDSKCILFLLSNFLVYLALIIPFTFIPDQVDQDGMTKHEAAFLASSIGIATTVSRIVFGWLGDRVCLRRLFLLVGVELLNGLVTMVSPYMATFEAKLAYTIIFGSLVGAYFTLVYVVITDIVRSDLIASLLGLLFLIFGIAAVVSPPLAGFLFDKTGSYTGTFLFSGAAFVLGGLLLLISQCVPNEVVCCKHNFRTTSVTCIYIMDN